VQQARQRVSLGPYVHRQLEHDRPVAQMDLLGQEHAAKRPASQLGHESEFGEPIADDGQAGGGISQLEGRVGITFVGEAKDLGVPRLSILPRVPRFGVSVAALAKRAIRAGRGLQVRGVRVGTAWSPRGRRDRQAFGSRNVRIGQDRGRHG
jgi:hypothetical protein